MGVESAAWRSFDVPQRSRAARQTGWPCLLLADLNDVPRATTRGWGQTRQIARNRRVCRLRVAGMIGRDGASWFLTGAWGAARPDARRPSAGSAGLHSFFLAPRCETALPRTRCIRTPRWVRIVTRSISKGDTPRGSVWNPWCGSWRKSSIRLTANGRRSGCQAIGLRRWRWWEVDIGMPGRAALVRTRRGWCVSQQPRRSFLKAAWFESEHLAGQPVQLSVEAKISPASQRDVVGRRTNSC